MAALMPQGKQQYFTAGGIPLVGGKVYTYAAGTTTPLATYTTAAASTPNANPVILDSRGEASIFFSAANYKIVVKDSLDSTIWTQDNLPGDAAASILVQLATSPGSTLVGHSGSGATTTTVAAQLTMLSRVSVYLKSANTAAQNKTAFQAAIASMTRPGKLLLPDGYFNIDPGIDLGPYVVAIEGGGKYQTYLGCTSGATAVYFAGLPDATLTEYVHIEGIGIDGGNNIQHGIRMAKCNHSEFFGNLITGTLSSALYIGGYSNDILENDIFSNKGSGIYLNGTLNNVNVAKNKVYANDGIGILLLTGDSNAGLGLNVKDNAIEANKVAGVIASNTKGLNIKDNYFERNAAVGYQYTVPESLLVRADVHLLASNLLTLNTNEVYSCREPTVSGNHSTAIGVYSALPNLDGFVFTTFARGLRVENNQMFAPSAINSMVSLYRNRLYGKVVQALKLSCNTVNSVNYIGTYDVNTQQHGTSHLINFDDQSIVKNYADPNFLAWGLLAGSTGTFIKSGNYFQGGPTWAMTDGDIQMGNVLDLTVYPEIKGKWVYFGMWVNDQGAATNARMFIDGQSSLSATDYDGGAVWTFKSTCQYIDPSAASLSYGVTKIGTGADLLVSHPVFAVVGNEYEKFPFADVTWKRAFYPLSGTWQVGDRVLNQPPVVGQPKSWVCTVAGTPGTWVSEGVL